MNNSRIIGNNINLELKKQSIERSDFANELGFSLVDVYRLIEGRLFVPPTHLLKISEILGITKEQLMENKGMIEYNSLVHNFRDFKIESNQELILDLIDMYADLAEAL